VNSFTYLGTMVNAENSIEDEIKERIASGNRAFHDHEKLFSSKLISRNFKLHVNSPNSNLSFRNKGT